MMLAQKEELSKQQRRGTPPPTGTRTSGTGTGTQTHAGGEPPCPVSQNTSCPSLWGKQSGCLASNTNQTTAEAPQHNLHSTHTRRHTHTHTHTDAHTHKHTHTHTHTHTYSPSSHPNHGHGKRDDRR